MWPVTRSTVIQGPGCQSQCGAASGWEGVVDVEGAADGEGAVGDVVEFAHGPLFLAVVDEEGTDFEGGGFVGFGVGCGVGLGVGDFADWRRG